MTRRGGKRTGGRKTAAGAAASSRMDIRGHGCGSAAGRSDQEVSLGGASVGGGVEGGAYGVMVTDDRIVSSIMILGAPHTRIHIRVIIPPAEPQP